MTTKTAEKQHAPASVRFQSGIQRKKGFEARVIPHGSDIIKYGCGHIGPLLFHFDCNGKILSPDRDELHKHEQCPNCLWNKLSKYLSTCAACGQPIKPGERVHFSVELGMRCTSNCVDPIRFNGYHTPEGFEPVRWSRDSHGRIQITVR